jgi:hypothetical protein
MGTIIHAAFWCACVVAFLVFFRKSTLLPKSASSSDTVKALCLKDVHLDSDGLSMKLTVRHSKTIQFGQRRLVIPFHPVPNSELCPVKAMSAVMSRMADLRPSPDQAPFSYQDCNGRIQSLTHSTFVRILKDRLGTCGLPAAAFSGHSFRRRGCTYAFSLGVPSLLIKLRGDGRSNAYERYISLSVEQHSSIAKILSVSLTQPHS